MESSNPRHLWKHSRTTIKWSPSQVGCGSASSEWCDWTGYQNSPSHVSSHALTCVVALSWWIQSNIMAFCSQLRCWNPQQSPSQGQEWFLPQWGICGHDSWLWSTQATMHSWVPMLCTDVQGFKTGRRFRNGNHVLEQGNFWVSLRNTCQKLVWSKIWGLAQSHLNFMWCSTRSFTPLPQKWKLISKRLGLTFSETPKIIV